MALTFEDIPAAAVQQAKRFLLDTVGCALGGFGSEDCEIAREVISEMGGRPEATIIGSGEKTNAVHAAFVNSLAVRVMDYNDVYWKQDPCHPSDLIPAALATGEREHRSGKDLITAINIAYDLEMRLCEAAFPGIRELGWHHATLTQFASPVVAGKMLGLTVEQMINAIGISGAHNATLGAVTAGELTMMKNTVDPMATKSGVLAALLAQKGYVGPEAIFEGREGLFAQVGRNLNDECRMQNEGEQVERSNVQTLNLQPFFVQRSAFGSWDPKKLTERLGVDFKITQCSMKAFPTEALTHSPITATLKLVHEHDLKPDDIETVIVTTIARAAEILADPSKYHITSKETADHSLPYCLAAAIADREVTPRQFKPDKLSDSRILNLVGKVKARSSDEVEKLFPAMQPCQVEIRTRSGQPLTARVDYPKGDPRDPLTEEQLKKKFSTLAEGVLSKERQEVVFKIVNELESVEDIGVLVEKLTA